MPTARLRVAGVTLALTAEPRGPALHWPAAYRPFLARRGADVALDVRWGLPAIPRGAERLFESGGAWACYAVDGERWYALRTRGPARPPDRVLRLDPARARGTLHVERGSRARGFALAYPLDDLLFQHHLAARGAPVIHACGLRYRGRGLVFCGHSGAGKTTTARLWRRHARGAVVLSDDRVVLRRVGDRVEACGTPWHGEGRFSSPLSAPLAALFFLRQARRNALVPLGPADAAARLMARSFPPPWDAAGVSAVLAACAEVAARTPAYELRFRPDAGAVEVVREALARGPSRRSTSPTR
ncbi:MAG TPA: hypothetical protein VF310_02095 [Vicinamibacteria bacterium]